MSMKSCFGMILLLQDLKFGNYEMIFFIKIH